MSFQTRNTGIKWFFLSLTITVIWACSFTQNVSTTQLVEVTQVIPVIQTLPSTRKVEATKAVSPTYATISITRTPTPQNWVFFSAGDTLYRMKLDGSYIETASRGVTGSEVLTVDSINSRLYISRWDAPAQILVFDLQGKDNINIFSDGPMSGGQGIAIDPVTSIMYLGLYYNGVYVKDIERSGEWMQLLDSTVLLPLHGQRGQLQVDPANHHVYFRTAYNGDCDLCRHIWRMDFDGSNPTEIIPANGGDALDLDLINKKLYFSDVPGNGTIMRANFDGSDSEIIFSIPPPYDFCRALVLDLINRKIYLSLYNEGNGYKGRLIARLNMDGTEFEMLYEISGSPPEISGGIALVLP